MKPNQLRSMLAAGLCAAAVAACDDSGGDLVSADGAPPRVLEVTVPSSIRANEILDVGFRAVSTAGIVSADVSAESDIVQDTTIVFDPPEAELDGFTQFRMPNAITRETIRVRVAVQDRLGARSDVVEVNVPVLLDGT